MELIQICLLILFGMTNIRFMTFQGKTRSGMTDKSGPKRKNRATTKLNCIYLVFSWFSVGCCFSHFSVFFCDVGC